MQGCCIQTVDVGLLSKVGERADSDKMIYVGDTAIMSETDVANAQGYIISAAVRKQDEETKRYILDEEGYSCTVFPTEEVFMMKSRLIPAKVGGWEVAKKRQIVFFRRGKSEERIATDGYHLIETNVVGRYEDETPWVGAARFRDQDGLLELNRVVTDREIVELYRGLWKLQEFFRPEKTFPRSIEAHVLASFVALLIVRILEIKKLNSSISCSKIMEALQAATVGEVHGNIYKNYCCSPYLREIGLATGLDLWKVFYTKQELRSLNNKTKDIY